MIKPIGMAEMSKIFEVTDAVGLSRESIVVPLAPAGVGSVRRLPDGRVLIQLPETTPLDEWLASLHEALLPFVTES